VVEGIETKAELDALATLGCDTAHGSCSVDQGLYPTP